MTPANVLSKLALPCALTWLDFSLVGLVLAMFYGRLASTANPIFVGVGVALMVGSILFAIPIWKSH
jgi:inner membrane protein involved in colicin E2 resistance